MLFRKLKILLPQCFLLLTSNLTAQTSLKNRFFYHYQEHYNKDSTRTYSDLYCLYFSDSIFYNFLISDTENEFYYYYNPKQSIKKNAKDIVKDFHYLNPEISGKYTTQFDNYILKIQTNNNSKEEFKSHQFFVDEHKLYAIFNYLEHSWNKPTIIKSNENEFLDILNYIELNPKFVQKHIQK